MMKLTINKQIFNDKYFKYIYFNNKRLQLIYGGSSSGKSYSTFTFAILWLLQGESILIARKVRSSLRRSVYNELVKAIDRLQVSHLISINKSELTFDCKYSKGCIVLTGVDDPEKIKSISPIHNSTFNRIVCEEASEFTKDDIKQLMLRQRGACKFNLTFMMLFNPIVKTHWIYKEYFSDIELNEDNVYESEDLFILKTTYKDNKFLGKDEIQTLEDMKERSPYHYDVYGLGNWGVLGDRIFINIQNNDIIPKLNLPVHVGMDLGFADPTVAVIVQYDAKENILYILDEVYGTELLPESISSKTKLMFERNNIQEHQEILVDNNEPRLIPQLRTLGLNINKTHKGSVLDGYLWLMQQTIVINNTCPRTLESFRNITWKKDRYGTITDTPEHTLSHCIDAVRYCTGEYWSGHQKISVYRFEI